MLKVLQNTHSQARVGTGEQELLSSLGEQLVLDPELAKIMTEEGELPVDFKAALKEMSAEEAEALISKLNQEAELAQTNQQALNEKLAEVMPENVTRLGEARDQRPVFVQNAESAQTQELKSLLNKERPAQQPLQQNTSLEQPLMEAKPKFRNAEDATRAFMPERKSIFAVQKEVAQPIKAQQAQQTQTSLNTEGLVNLKDFMSKQSGSGQARALTSQYKNEQQSMLTNKAFAEKQMPHIATATVMATDTETNAGLEDWSHGQEQLMGHKMEAASNIQSGASQKVFDINSMNRTNDLDATIGQIQDYILQAKAAKEPTAQMTFNHPELGDVDIFVKKGMGDQVHVTIGHQSQEAAKFFQQHQGELLQSLSQSGVQVGEFKLESSSSNNNQNNNQNADQQGKQQFAGQNRSNQEQQRKEDSHRREELWNLLNEERKFA